METNKIQDLNLILTNLKRDLYNEQCNKKNTEERIEHLSKLIESLERKEDGLK